MGQKNSSSASSVQELKTPLPTHITNPKNQNWQRSITGINKEGIKPLATSFSPEN
jgi:hypothetical protein